MWHCGWLESDSQVTYRSMERKEKLTYSTSTRLLKSALEHMAEKFITRLEKNVSEQLVNVIYSRIVPLENNCSHWSLYSIPNDFITINTKLSTTG